MALSTAIRETATRLNRERQHRAELRLDEIVKTAGIADDYEKVDRAGDLMIERQFGLLYHLVDTEDEKEAVAAAFAAWMKSEADEDKVVRGSVGSTVSLLKRNNDVWINGAAVPPESNGAA